MLYALTHINKVVEALCLLLILSAKESMFRAKKRPIAESICNGDKKLPQMVVVMSFFDLIFLLKEVQ